MQTSHVKTPNVTCLNNLLHTRSHQFCRKKTGATRPLESKILWLKKKNFPFLFVLFSLIRNFAARNNKCKMKKALYILIPFLAAILFASCKNSETYAQQKDKEYKAIKSFLDREVVIRDEDGSVLCNVGKITPISEEQFLLQDSTTDLEKNEYVLFQNTGVYMQIVRKGTGEKLERGKTARVICRFIEFNILGDSIQLRNDVYFWHSSPDIMKISNNYGSFAANFDTESNGGGAMYNTYGSTSVPSGWLVPFSYIRIGRQESADEGIAKVRLIVPHTEGQTSATGNVYPCFYELTFQKMRD